jgi:hypothetical protein
LSTPVTTKVDRNAPAGLSVDVGEIHTLPQESLARPVVRLDLLPEEERASLPQQFATADSTIEPLNRFLGPALTFANPVWTGDPVPRLRGLQKKLVEHSLTLDQSDRSECMAAISVVETAVQLRLRLQQMRMTEEEAESAPKGDTEQ